MNATPTPPNFDATLTSWLKKVQDLIDAHHEAQGFKNFPPGKVSIDPGGKKYLRIVKDSSAFAFIDLATGDVLKPDGWKRPAKGARGNIFSENLGVGPYGALYVR